MSGQFDWKIFSFQMESFLELATTHCSWALYEDVLEMGVYDRHPLRVTEEDKGTVYAKEILLDWRAKDMGPDFSPEKYLPRRDHEKLLRKSFECRNMRAKNHGNRWTAIVSVPRDITQWEHKVVDLFKTNA